MKTLRFLVAPFGACLVLYSVHLVHSVPPSADAEAPPSILPVAVSDEASRNLLANGDFTAGIVGWELLNWGKKTRMKIDPAERHDGHPVLRVDNLAIAHSFIRQTLTGKPHTRYRLSGYIKTRNIDPWIQTQTSGAVLMAGRLGAYTPLQAGTKPWTKVSVEFTTTEDSTIRVGPSLGTDSSFCTGTAWFAELQLVELRGHDQNLHAEATLPHHILPNSASLLASASHDLATFSTRH